ncbi:hypothetical protein BGZ65_009240 [Modicella reniformis]|uniref:C2H2-type domain-containing protein n=1 Tax=Modicella reniformis TaxID=1440133 RepID=A0A9P6ILP4_9FUNG|nr:hypothetical protein BGZ65_009240 [Modicella reniformis]
MSSASSCASSPFSSPETAGAEMDILEMPMFFPSEQSIYQQIFELDGSPDLLMQQQQQQSHPQQQSYPMYSSVQPQKQQLQYGMIQMGLGTPPTSPPAQSFHKYMASDETGTIYYASQSQAIQNVYVFPVQPLPQQQQHLHPSSEQQQIQPQQQQQLLEEQLAYQALMQHPTASNSPFAAESPLMPISSDFDLFPMNNNVGNVQQSSAVGYPSLPVMAPSPVIQSSIYGQTDVYHQMTPPMNQMDLEREVSLFKHDAINAGSSDQQPMTTELSLLCNCPGKFPCGEQLSGEPIEDMSSSSGSPLQEIRELEYSESDSQSEEEQEEENEQDPTYIPAPRARSNTTESNYNRARPKSMMISTSSSNGAPYNSPFSKDSPSSPKNVRHDRRRSGSYSSGGHSHHHQLLEPEQVPEIKDIHVCPVCQRRFTRPFNLRSHLMTHTTARPFPCDECHWKFTRQHDLLRHKRAKHPNSLTNNTPTNAGPKNDAKSHPVTAA